MTDAEKWLSPLRERGLVPDDMVAASLVGSLARGWANPQSDVDIAVFVTREWESDACMALPLPLNPPRVMSEGFNSGDRRWEVVYWTLGQVDQMLAKVSWEQFERNVVAQGLLHPREEILISRLEHGVPLAGVDWLATAHERVRTSAFRSFMMTRSLAASDDAVEDALGQLEGGDFESAVLSARRALGHSVDALLESHGEYLSLIPKWRPQRFRAASPALLDFDRYWELESMRTYDQDAPASWVTEVLGVCQDIALRVDLQP
ncbi:nucleotidyltransferase domain-containing protein [Nocardioides campestrisoli]|uniref:nucleotidyltransferase domain-containing protein n=1 Tax=Nocardioides campestrisoli TaxID=2736757 RepID=UPI00163D871C|nr:nucleotidyltransferase domain-containing protein [Nocardioides campestrisoli]